MAQNFEFTPPRNDEVTQEGFTKLDSMPSAEAAQPERKCVHKQLNFGVLGCKECEEFAGRRAWTWLINKDYLPEAAQPISQRDERMAAFDKVKTAIHGASELEIFSVGYDLGWQAARAGRRKLAEAILAEQKLLDEDSCQDPHSHYSCYMESMRRLTKLAGAALTGAGEKK